MKRRTFLNLSLASTTLPLATLVNASTQPPKTFTKLSTRKIEKELGFPVLSLKQDHNQLFHVQLSNEFFPFTLYSKDGQKWHSTSHLYNQHP